MGLNKISIVGDDGTTFVLTKDQISTSLVDKLEDLYNGHVQIDNAVNRPKFKNYCLEVFRYVEDDKIPMLASILIDTEPTKELSYGKACYLWEKLFGDQGLPTFLVFRDTSGNNLEIMLQGEKDIAGSLTCSFSPATEEGAGFAADLKGLIGNCTIAEITRVRLQSKRYLETTLLLFMKLMTLLNRQTLVVRNVKHMCVSERKLYEQVGFRENFWLRTYPDIITWEYAMV